LIIYDTPNNIKVKIQKLSSHVIGHVDNAVKPQLSLG